MLRLRDARTGQWREFAGAASMRVHVCGGGLRGMLVADLIRRARTVLGGRAPVVTSAVTSTLPDDAELADWNIHPPTAVGATADRSYPATPATAGSPPDVLIGCRDGEACALDVGALSFETGPIETGPIETGPIDPLVLRLAALEFHDSAPARLDAARVHAADATLAGWRAAVSAWARSPGAAMSMPYIDRMAAAVEDDLAVAKALQALRDLEHDETVSPGARFETFAYADRLLGVDLARDVGR